jgi:broad specificity phosphatase PhoE
MQIVLMRHGRPAIDGQQRLSARSFGAWVDQYNAAAIDPASPPPAAAISQARLARHVLCSTLPRSLTSAAALGIDAPHGQDTAFRELEMPHADWHFPILPVGLWSVLFRLAWALGYHRHAESFASARTRAAACATTLSQLAATHGSVLFIGHGALNGFIAQALRRSGWHSPDSAPRHYWQYAIFSRPTIQAP